MARTEHEDWARYLRDAGWECGPRDDRRKKNPRLVEWDELIGDRANVDKALKSLAGTLVQLQRQGFRASPWRRYRRTGTVHAVQRSAPWTWISEGGEAMQAAANDWEVSDGSRTWSVKDGIFQNSYEKTKDGMWRRAGVVLARRAIAGEQVTSHEGVTTAVPKAWVLKRIEENIVGDETVVTEDRWTVPDEKFRVGYEGPI
jgi:hypothetical protein